MKVVTQFAGALAAVAALAQVLDWLGISPESIRTALISEAALIGGIFALPVLAASCTVVLLRSRSTRISVTDSKRAANGSAQTSSSAASFTAPQQEVVQGRGCISVSVSISLIAFVVLGSTIMWSWWQFRDVNFSMLGPVKPTPTIQAIIPPTTPQPSPSVVIWDVDCSDFNSPEAAQAVYFYLGGPESDPFNLDGNKDGIACDRSDTVLPIATPQSATVSPILGPDMDCVDFASSAEAQAVFESLGGPEVDPYNLDPDRDGVACETG